jgi:cytochrome c oxidase subunit II
VRKHPFVQMFVIGLIACAILIPIGLAIHWFPNDASAQLHRTKTLYDVLLICSVPIFVGVETVILYSVWKFRMRPGEEQKDGPPIHGNTRLEVVWTGMPALLILALCIYSYIVLTKNEQSQRGERVINITERQFAFEFSYPLANGKTVDSPVLYLANKQPVLFHIRSLDVIHSFFVPEFAEKLDAVPGITTILRVTPTRLGSYPAECTELCGAGHSLMRAAVRVVTPAAFNAWLAHQPTNSAPPVGEPPSFAKVPGVPGTPVPASILHPAGSSTPSSSSSSSPGSSTGSSGSSSSSSSAGSSSGSTSAASIAAGKAVFTGSAGCSGCHTLAAAAASGTVGPDLDARLKSDCALPASIKVRGATLKQCITTAIEHPYAFIPSGYAANVMPPNFASTLSPTQIQALVNFISTDVK